MRLIKAVCEIEYGGRCSASRSKAVRLVIIKDDGSVLIHSDENVKALNYMKASKNVRQDVLEDGTEYIWAENSKEWLLIKLHEILEEVIFDFPQDKEPKMKKKQTEDELQQYVLDNFSSLIPGAEGICREFDTSKGPVDVLGYDPDNNRAILVEIKRNAQRKDVYQVLKYRDGTISMARDLKRKGVRAIEAKRKGDNDGRGPLIPVEAFERAELYLASTKFSKLAITEAEDHIVRTLQLYWDFEKHKPPIPVEELDNSEDAE